MIDRFERALTTLLLQELATPHDEQEMQFELKPDNVTFEQPTRTLIKEWPKPAINLFLHDMRENNRLRGQQPVWNGQRREGQEIRRRQPLTFDLHYMITIWTADNERERQHPILFAVLMALLRNDGLPDALRRQHLPEMEEGVSFKVAQYETHTNPREIWSVLDNEMRLAIDLVATLSINPFHYEFSPLVREVETIFHNRKRGQP